MFSTMPARVERELETASPSGGDGPSSPCGRGVQQTRRTVPRRVAGQLDVLCVVFHSVVGVVCD